MRERRTMKFRTELRFSTLAPARVDFYPARACYPDRRWVEICTVWNGVNKISGSELVPTLRVWTVWRLSWGVGMPTPQVNDCKRNYQNTTRTYRFSVCRFKFPVVCEFRLFVGCPNLLKDFLSPSATGCKIFNCVDITTFPTYTVEESKTLNSSSWFDVLSRNFPF